MNHGHRLKAPISAAAGGMGLLLLLASPAFGAIGTPYAPSETTGLGYTSEQTTSISPGLMVYTMTRIRTNPITNASVTETLRQVAGPDGVIFGLSWSGIHHPRLGPLLGNRLPTQLPFSRGPRILSTPHLELRMSGTVLHSEGMAWDPALVPNGISLSNVLAIP